MQILPIKAQDAAAFYAFLEKNKAHLTPSFPVTIQFCTSLEACVRFVEKKIMQAESQTSFYYLLWEQGQLLGMVTAKEIDWTVPKAEIAYFIDQDLQGKGLASEALSHLFRHCFGRLSMEKLYARVFPDNKASCRVLEKQGFVNEGLLRKEFRDGNGELKDLCYMGLTREDYILS